MKPARRGKSGLPFALIEVAAGAGTEVCQGDAGLEGGTDYKRVAGVPAQTDGTAKSDVLGSQRRNGRVGGCSQARRIVAAQHDAAGERGCQNEEEMTHGDLQRRGCG